MSVIEQNLSTAIVHFVTQILFSTVFYYNEANVLYFYILCILVSMFNIFITLISRLIISHAHFLILINTPHSYSID